MWEIINDWKGILWGIIAAAAGGAWWGLKKRFVTREEFDKEVQEISRKHTALRDEQSTISVRLEKIESVLKDLPKAKDLHDLTLTLSDFRGDFKAVGVKVDRVEKQVDRIDEYMRDGGSRVVQ
ncbi:MAG: DUF2730 family protein [Alphaproteobacteria bacterium]|nr:DUF2730 family protein [Alphaproteobacteria bacterium]